jgi:DnaJ-class molecular chaperone
MSKERTIVDHNPVLGVSRWRVRDCSHCGGSGALPWHVGCGDSEPDPCGKCEGTGVIGRVITTGADNG